MTVGRLTTLGVFGAIATSPGWDKGAIGARAIHKTQGWSDIGYNEIINPDVFPEPSNIGRPSGIGPCCGRE